jgi:hypothetical protein
VTKLLDVKRLVMLSAIATLAALGLMVVSIISPNPLFLVIAMSVGQGLGTLSLALYLLAIVLDLQSSGAANAAEDAEANRERSGA